MKAAVLGSLLISLLVGCHEYSITLEQTGTSPLPVLVGDNVEMPAGLLVTVVPRALRDGEEYDATVDLESEDERILTVTPIESEVDNEWALLAVAPGLVDIVGIIDDTHTASVDALVTEQDPPSAGQ